MNIFCPCWMQTPLLLRKLCSFSKLKTHTKSTWITHDMLDKVFFGLLKDWLQPDKQPIDYIEHRFSDYSSFHGWKKRNWSGWYYQLGRYNWTIAKIRWRQRWSSQFASQVSHIFSNTDQKETTRLGGGSTNGARASKVFRASSKSDLKRLIVGTVPRLTASEELFGCLHNCCCCQKRWNSQIVTVGVVGMNTNRQNPKW